MTILFIELLIIVVLVMIFSMVIIDEKRARARNVRVVKLKGYWDENERRSVERLDVALEVKYAVNGKFANSKSADISTKGIRLLLDEKFEKNTPLRLEIKLPGRKQVVKASGEVVWAAAEQAGPDGPATKRFFNTGIKFYKFYDGGEKNLTAFIDSLGGR